MSSDSIIEWSEFENMACLLDDFDFEDDTPPSNFSLSALLVYDPSPLQLISLFATFVVI